MRPVVTSFLTGNWPHLPGTGSKDLGSRYATVLAATLARFAPQADFVLWTDRTADELPGIDCRPIPALPGWFGSIYQFAPEAFPEGTRILSMDLDTAVIGDLTPFLEVPLDKLVGIGDTGNAVRGQLCNGIMSWEAGPRYWPIWNNFKHNVGRPPPFDSPVGRITTDEAWLRWHVKSAWVSWAKLLPRMSRSYKNEVLRGNKTVDDGARIIYFHGNPRPHTVAESWNPHRT
jgi:hypothetical protein